MLQNTINVIASEVKHVPEKKYSFVEYTAPPQYISNDTEKIYENRVFFNSW